MARKLEIIIAGDASNYQAALRGASKQTSGFQKGLNTASVAAGGALLALGAAAKVGFGEFIDAQKVGAQTAAVIKSTGGAANVTAGDVDRLSSALMKKSGVDDEVIASGQNMLLTFTKVRNEAGKGNDVFNQATKATLDLSVAMGKDMSSSAILVGKALNDPIKGMGALSKAGIQFTDAQKDQIKTMVAAGNSMGAQKMILKELETQFGGSAEAAGKTFSGKMNIAKETAKNFAGQLVSGAMPALQKLVDAFAGATKWMTEHESATKIIIGVTAGLAVGIIALNAVMRVGAAVSAALTAAQWLLNSALLANPIGIVVVALVGLGAAFVIAWKKSETFRDIVTDTWNTIKSVVQSVWGFIGPFVQARFDGIVQAARGFFDTVKGAFNIFAGLFTGDWDRMWDGIKTMVTGAFSVLVGIVRAAFAGLGTAALELGKHIVSSIGDGLANLAGRVRSFLDDVPGAIRSFLGAVGAAALDLGERILSGIGSGLAALGRKLVEWIKAPVNAMISGVNSVIGRINSAVSFEISMPGPIPDISVDPPDIPTIPHLATGGHVLETGLAVIHRGETVVPARTSPLSRFAATINITVIDRTFAGMSREQTRRVAEQLRPELDRQVRLATG